MSEGKFFAIRSKLNELVLDIEDGNATPGAKIITWDYNGGNNQLWWQDYVAGVIRSRLDENLVLEVADGELIVNNYQPDEYNQKWRPTGETISHVENSDLVLDVADQNEDPGAHIISYEYQNTDNQHWTFEYQSPQYFFIHTRNERQAGKVMDVDLNEGAGARIIMFERKTPDHKDGWDNQLFWEDKYGIIHGKMNDMVFDSTEGKVYMQEYDHDMPKRQYVYSNGKIVLKGDNTNCIQIQDADDMKLFKKYRIEEATYEAQPFQKWWLEYLH